MHTVKIFYLNSEEFLIKMGEKRLLEYSEGRVFKSEKRMVQLCLGRFLIKHVLENEYGIHSPVISVQNRKPYLENGDIKFSLSHSKNIIIAAFAHYELGLDIEFMKGRDFESICSYLERKTGNPDADTFYRFWTKYEAGIKLQNDPVSWFSTKLEKDFMLTVCAAQKEDVTPDIRILKLNDAGIISEQRAV